MALPYLGLGLVTCLVIYGIALIQARATMYTITTARVAMRIGMLTITLNLPHRQILSASLDLRRNGARLVLLLERLADHEVHRLLLGHSARKAHETVPTTWRNRGSSTAT